LTVFILSAYVSGGKRAIWSGNKAVPFQVSCEKTRSLHLQFRKRVAFPAFYPVTVHGGADTARMKRSRRFANGGNTDFDQTPEGRAGELKAILKQLIQVGGNRFPAGEYPANAGEAVAVLIGVKELDEGMGKSVEGGDLLQGAGEWPVRLLHQDHGGTDGEIKQDRDEEMVGHGHEPENTVAGL
jgi:hypothetical protein